MTKTDLHIRVPQPLHDRLKALAIEQGVTVTALINIFLQMMLIRHTEMGIFKTIDKNKSVFDRLKDK